jgi:DNA-3-methyladenine glycosylase II
MLVLVEFEFDGSELLTARAIAPGEAGVGSASPVSTERLEGVAATSWGLADDLDACLSTLSEDQDFAPVAARYQGMRLARVPGLFEALLVAILGQQISVQAANACRLRLMASLGEHLEVAGTTYTTYPPPQSLLAAGEEELRALGTGKQKARYLHALAEAAIAGKLEQAVFDGLSDEEAIALLCEIPGVGRWTAEVALLRGLGRLDAFPAGDLGLQVAAQRVLRLEARPSESQLRAIAERWRPWRGYAALYLWSYLRDST